MGEKEEARTSSRRVTTTQEDTIGIGAIAYVALAWPTQLSRSSAHTTNISTLQQSHLEIFVPTQPNSTQLSSAQIQRESRSCGLPIYQLATIVSGGAEIPRIRMERSTAPFHY